MVEKKISPLSLPFPPPLPSAFPYYRPLSRSLPFLPSLPLVSFASSLSPFLHQCALHNEALDLLSEVPQKIFHCNPLPSQNALLLEITRLVTSLIPAEIQEHFIGICV